MGRPPDPLPSFGTRAKPVRLTPSRRPRDFRSRDGLWSGQRSTTHTSPNISGTCHGNLGSGAAGAQTHLPGETQGRATLTTDNSGSRSAVRHAGRPRALLKQLAGVLLLLRLP